MLNVIFNISASFTMRAASLVVTSLLVKEFGQEAFGNYIYIITTALLLTTFSAMATGQAFIRNLSSAQQTSDSFIQYFTNIFILFCLFASLLYLYAFWLSSNQHIIDNYYFIIIVAFLELINTAYISYFSGKEKFANIFNARLIFSFFLCAVVFLTTYWDTYYTVYPYIFALLLSNGYFIWAARQEKQQVVYQAFTLNTLRYFYQKYIKLSLPIFISGLMVTPVQWYLSNQIVLQNSFAELGLFNVSMQFRMMILMVTSSLATALLPRLVKLNNTEAFDRIKQSGYFFSATLCIFMIIGIALFMPLIFTFYNIALNDDILLACYMMLSTALPLCIYNIYTQVLIAKGKTKRLLLFNSFWGICVIALYNMSEIINNISAAKILCVSYFSLIVFVVIYNKLNTMDKA